MIEMFVNDQALTLPDDLNIRIELNFPTFESDVIPASIIYHFDLPFLGNESILNYSNHIEVMGKFYEYPWRMNFDGINLFSGKLIVTSVAEVFRCAVTLRQLPADFADKNIDSFTFPTLQLVPTGSGINNTSQIPGITHKLFTLPKIYAPELFSSNPAWCKIVNRFPSTEQNRYSESAIPIFYVFKILEIIFTSEDFFVAYSDSALAKNSLIFDSLLFFNNYTLDTSPEEYVGTSSLNIYYYKNNIYPKNHLPAISVNSVLVGLKQMFTLTTFVDNQTNMVQFLFFKDIADSKILDLSDIVLDGHEVLINEPTAFHLKFSDDDYKVDGPVTAYGTLSHASTPSREDLLISVQAVNSYYKSVPGSDFTPGGDVIDILEWKRVGNSFFPLKTNPDLSKTEEVSIEASPMPMDYFANTPYPFYEEGGVSPRFAPDASKTDKLIFFFTDKLNRNLGTSSEIQSNGTVYSDRPGLKIGTSYGLYNKLLKPWYDFLENANEYTFSFKCSIEDILRIIPIFGYQEASTRDQIRRIRVRNQVYIPKQFTFELTHTKITCQAKLMKDDGNH